MPWNDGLVGVALQIAGTNHSPLRVMAGPGTGKSFVMKRRVARLLERGVNPERILAVTFTRTAAASLVEDLNGLGVAGCEQIRAGTLHSFCFSLLGQQDVFDYLGRVPRPLVTFSSSGILQFEGRTMLDDLIRADRRFGPKRECTKRIRAFEAAWARLQSEDPGWPHTQDDRDFHQALLAWLSFHKAILIGELVPEALRFLRNNPASPALTSFDHVIVDEYQDLNRAEQDLIDLLAANGTTAIVGDTDQSIYRFRHANPEGIELFHQTHQVTHDEDLQECRRCPTRVVAIADYLIRHNYPRGVAARLQPKPDNPAGEVHIVQWPTLEEEAEGLAEYVRWLVENQGIEPGQILVLTPRRLLGYRIRNRLIQHVPVHSFYHEEPLEEEAAQSAFALLSLLADPNDRVALRWWLGYSNNTGRAAAYRRLRTHCEATGDSPWDVLSAIDAGAVAIPRTGELLTRFRLLRETLAKLRPLPLNELIDELMPNGDDAVSAIRTAASLAIERSNSVAEVFNSVRAAVTQPETPSDADYVRIMSLHKSKGLTSKVVLVAGCIQGLIPVENIEETPPEQRAILEEQRRLFYVAITRCTDVLVISSSLQLERRLARRLGARIRRGGGDLATTVASQFLDELGPTGPRPVLGGHWRNANYA